MDVADVVVVGAAEPDNADMVAAVRPNRRTRRLLPCPQHMTLTSTMNAVVKAARHPRPISTTE